MSQGSYHEERVFISCLKERKLVTRLLTADITMEDFLNSPQLRSDNINLIKELVQEVSVRYRGQIPCARHCSARSVLVLTALRMRAAPHARVPLAGRCCQTHLWCCLSQLVQHHLVV